MTRLQTALPPAPSAISAVASRSSGGKYSVICGETGSAATGIRALSVTSTVSYSWPSAGGRFRWPPTLERRDVAVGDHCIADRNAVGELVTPEYDG
jgi:hypothetical protein